MTTETETVDDGLRRVIEAAEAANDAAEDVSRLGKAHQDFAARVTRAQKRTTALASGAAVGAVVALGLASLVYFRSVADLREAAELQTEAASLVAAEVLRLKELREGADAETATLTAAINALPETILSRQAEAAASAPQSTPESATNLTEALRADLRAVEEEILASLAELDLRLSGNASMQGTGPTGETVTPVDLPGIAAALARIEAGVLKLSAGPAAPPRSQAQAPAQGTRSKSTATGGQGGARAAAPAEPNPFSYP